jgi:mannose-6-phosphate isomerase
MKKLYPLKFKSILKNKIWGGDKIVSCYNKQFCEDETIDITHIGESWEICDMFGDQTIVNNGFLEGNSLEEILETYLGDLVGEKVYDYYRNQFPLMVKILDINNFISVQVHPDDTIAAERYDSYGKKECWYVLEASDDAVLYLGFRKDVTASELYYACKNGTVVDLMNEYHPRKGDYFEINPGCVHSAGGGLIVYEVQQASEITLRLYDWSRENNPDTARRIDLEEALDIIDYSAMPEPKADNDFFSVSIINLQDDMEISPEDVNSFIIYFCAEGVAKLHYENEVYFIEKGECILIPASLDNFTLKADRPGTILVETHINVPIEEPDSYLN